MKRHPLPLLLLLAFLLEAPLAALAHATLTVSEPADGAHLTSPPTVITLRFDEVVTPLSMRLHGTAETPLRLPQAGQVLQIPLPPNVGSGGYVMSWRVVSADGHPISGAVAFAVGEAAVPTRSGHHAPAGSSGWGMILMVLRIVFLSAFAIACGGALFSALVTWPTAGSRKASLVAAASGALAAILSVGVAGAWFGDTPASALLDGATWLRGARSPFAASLAVSVLGLALCAVAAGGSTGWRRIAMLVGAGVAAMGFPFAGHAATAEPRWLSAAALAAHAFGAAFWLGSFRPLLAQLAAGAEGAVPVFARFSRLAMLLVPALLLTGIILALLRLSRLQDLFASDYGGLLCAKLGLVGGMLALAAWNRWRLAPALQAGDRQMPRLLTRSIQAEMALGLAVLGLTAILARTAPPVVAHAAAMAEPQADINVFVDLGGHPATIVFSPGTAGATRITARTGGMAIAEAWLVLEQPARGIGPIRRPLRATGDGVLTHDGAELIVGGQWQFRIECLVNDFERIDGTGQVDLPETPGGAGHDHHHGSPRVPEHHGRIHMPGDTSGSAFAVGPARAAS